MPKVSIITALFNHERFIAQAIESVLAQTYQDWELVVWDDGSSDRGLEIAREYERKYSGKIKVYTHPGGANRGQEATRNAALAVARGEYLGLLDSDDLYEPRKLELLVPLLADPEVALAYGAAEVLIEASGRRIAASPRKLPSGRIFPRLLEDNFISAGATLFRHSCVRDGLRFATEYRTMGEYPAWLKIAHDWKVASVPEVVAVWRDHGANLGTKLALQAKKELVRLFERLEAEPAYADHAAAIGRGLAQRRYDYANELFYELQLEETRRQCRAAALAPHATKRVRAKAAALYALTFGGRGVGASLSRLKRAIWELRHPIAARSRRALRDGS